VVVDAISGQAAEFYRHFDFRDLDERRLWRRLTDVERSSVADEGSGSSQLDDRRFGPFS